MLTKEKTQIITYQYIKSIIYQVEHGILLNPKIIFDKFSSMINTIFLSK